MASAAPTAAAATAGAGAGAGAAAGTGGSTTTGNTVQIVGVTGGNRNSCTSTQL